MIGLKKPIWPFNRILIFLGLTLQDSHVDKKPLHVSIFALPAIRGISVGLNWKKN